MTTRLKPTPIDRTRLRLLCAHRNAGSGGMNHFEPSPYHPATLCARCGHNHGGARCPLITARRTA